MIYLFIALVGLLFVQVIIYKTKSSKVNRQVEGAKAIELQHYADNKMGHFVDDKDRNILHLISLENVTLSKDYEGITFGSIARKVLSDLDINAQDFEGNTALHYAVDRPNNGEIVKFLLDQGIDMNRKNKNGQTPFMKVCALSDYHYSEAQRSYDLLLPHQNINDQDLSGWTSLMYATHAGNLAFIHDLLDKGADGKLKNKNGQTAYDLADPMKHHRTSSKPGGDEGVERHNFSVDEAFRRLKCVVENKEFVPRKFVRASRDPDMEIE